MTKEQRAARYILKQLLEQIAVSDASELRQAAEDIGDEIVEHVGSDWSESVTFGHVRRYAERLANSTGFSAEQGLEEDKPDLDGKHYTDRFFGWGNRSVAKARRDCFYPHDDLEQKDDGKWIIVAR